MKGNPMNTQAYLRQKAIEAAKNRDWEEAVAINSQIIETNSSDTGALTRLGVAYMQTDEKNQAKQMFQQVLTLDPSNNLAKKHLQKLKTNQVSTLPSFSRNYFIEEPGKTKTVELCRLAGKNILDTLSVGQQCSLKQKSRYISVEVDGQNIGALPEDLSFRLSKLINSGNTYSCTIRSCSNNTCFVYLKETHRSPENVDIHSFPITRATGMAINDIADEEFLLDDTFTSDSDSDSDEEFDDQAEPTRQDREDIGD